MLILSAKDSDVLRLSTGRFQLGPGLLDLNFGADTSLKADLVQLQGLLILCHGRLQKLFLGIETTRLEVEQSQCECIARLTVAKSAALACAASRYDSTFLRTAPRVDLVGQLNRQLEVVLRATIGDCSSGARLLEIFVRDALGAAATVGK